MKGMSRRSYVQWALWGLALTVVMMGMLLHSASGVHALSCAPPGPVEEELKASSVVFMGEVLERNKEGLAVFRVEKAWKGIKEPSIQIYDNGWDPFRAGGRYLVFGTEQDGKLRMNLCGRSGIWTEAADGRFREAGIQAIYLQESGDVLEAEVTRSGTTANAGAEAGDEGAAPTGAWTADKSDRAAQAVLAIACALGTIVLIAVLRGNVRRR